MVQICTLFEWQKINFGGVGEWDFGEKRIQKHKLGEGPAYDSSLFKAASS